MKVIIIALAVILFTAASVDANVNCSRVEISGKVYNFDRLVSFGTLTTNSGYDYTFAVCQNVPNPQNVCGQCQQFGACQSYEDTSYCLGRFQNSIIDFSADEKSVSMTYSQGDLLKDEDCYDGQERTATIVIECNPDVIDQPKVIGVTEPPCDHYDYKIEFIHADGCPVDESAPSPELPTGGKKISVGSILLIIIFVSFFVYLIAGVVVNAAIRKQTGKDIIPNREFWVDLPYLVKDGFLFIVHKVRPPSEEGYTTVE